MGRIKKNQHVVVFVEKDNFKTTGVVTEIRKGTYDKSTGEYSLDIYVVKGDVNGDTIYCNKSNLTKIDEPAKAETEVGKPKEEVFTASVQVGDRVVTVVGVRKTVNDMKARYSKVSTFYKDVKKEVEGVGFFVPMVKTKQFSIGHSICHPSDSFDERIGYEKAYNRAKVNNNRVLTTTSWTMLQNDQCKMLVQHEAEYIANNIERFIK